MQLTTHLHGTILEENTMKITKNQIRQIIREALEDQVVATGPTGAVSRRYAEFDMDELEEELLATLRDKGAEDMTKPSRFTTKPSQFGGPRLGFMFVVGDDPAIKVIVSHDGRDSIRVELREYSPFSGSFQKIRVLPEPGRYKVDRLGMAIFPDRKVGEVARGIAYAILGE